MKVLNKPSVRSASTTLSPGERLWRNKDFNMFWFGQTLSGLGDSFALIAFPLLVLQATGSVAQMGLVTAMMAIGQVLAGIFAGIFVDRFNRRWLMIICDTIRALLYLAIPLCWVLFGPQIWLIYIVVGFGGCFGMIFQVTYVAAISNMVDGDQITEANGRMQTTYAVAFVLGPVLAGVVTAAFGATQAITIDVCTFAISALSLLFIRLRPVTQRSALDLLKQEPDEQAIVQISGQKKAGIFADFLVGLTFIWRQPVMRPVMFLLGMFSILTTGMLDLFIFELKHDLGQSDFMVGVVFGLASIGSIAGGILTPWLRRRLGFGPCWLGGYIVNSLAIILIGLWPNLIVMAVLAMCYTLSNTVSAVTSMSLRQQITPNYILGRVTSVFWTISSALGPLGAALITALGARIGTLPIIFWVGIACLINTVSGIFTPARRRFPERAA